MRRLSPLPRMLAILSCSIAGLLASSTSLADEQARMSLNVMVQGSGSSRAGTDWSNTRFSYELAYSTVVATDGELGNANIYDPDYAQKMMQQAAASMARIEAARRGEFSDEEPEPEGDYRYLLYIGQMECDSTFSVKVQEVEEGEYADVGGMQPFTRTFTADYSGGEMERMLLCATGGGVLDVKENTLYRAGLGFPEIRGHYVYHEANRGNLQDDPEAQHSALPQVVSDYLFETLRIAPASGAHRATLTPDEDSQASIEVAMEWSFEPL